MAPHFLENCSGDAITVLQPTDLYIIVRGRISDVLRDDANNGRRGHQWMQRSRNIKRLAVGLIRRRCWSLDERKVHRACGLQGAV